VQTQGAGWAGIFWQQPANNWGTSADGYDLTGYSRLTFWARGEMGGEEIAEFGVGGITGTYPDSGSARIRSITLGPEWQQHVVDLNGVKLSRIAGGFVFSASRADNPSGLVLYLDDIQFEK
jgi:hypothetical protein